MMNKRSSTRIYERLMRQAIVNGRTAIQTGHGKTASSRKALSFMGWANAIADREGEGLHSPPTGRSRRMGMGEKDRSRGPGQFNREVVKTEAVETTLNNPDQSERSQPGPKARPVLRLVSSRHRGAQRITSAPPCLTLIMGGKN